MPPLQTEFDDLTTVVDRLHALFERWAAGAVAGPAVDPVAREVLKLAVHEWVANLVQHADFGGRRPLIRLRVLSEGRRARCVVEDNSAGFDLAAEAAAARAVQETSPVPTERGRGLLIVLGCTENLSYRPCPPLLGGDGLGDAPWQRLEFWVAPGGDGLDPLPLGPFFEDDADGPALEAWVSPALGPDGALGQEGAPHPAPRPDSPPPA